MSRNRFKKVTIILATLLAPALITTAAYAHVIVTPSQVGVAAFQTFTVGVPNERDNPVVGLRLIIPDGLQSVAPNVKPGWKIDVKKTGDGDNATTTEISWTGGLIPLEQRDDFVFNAQVPDKATVLTWKAYQTYQDGSVDAWENPPQANATDKEIDASKPYSETKIVDDLTSSASTTSDKSSTEDRLPLYISIAAVIIAGASFLRKPRKV